MAADDRKLSRDIDDTLRGVSGAEERVLAHLSAIARAPKAAAERGYWGALAYRAYLLEELAAFPGFHAAALAAAPEEIPDDDLDSTIGSERKALLRELTWCNQRLGTLFDAGGAQQTSRMVQMIDGAVQAVRHIDDFSDRPKWVQLLGLLALTALIYFKYGSSALLLPAVAISFPIGVALLGAVSALLRPFVGMGWFGRVLRGLIGGIAMGAVGLLPCYPLLFAISRPLQWVAPLSAALIGAIYGPILMPGDSVAQNVYRAG